MGFYLVEKRGGKSKHFDNDLKKILDKLNHKISIRAYAQIDLTKQV